MTVPLVLLDDPATVAATARRLRDSGHRVQDGFALPPDPFELTDERLMCAAPVVDHPTAAAAILAGVRGCGLLVAVDAAAEVAGPFLRDLAKLGPVTRRAAVAPTSGGGASLTADQRELLGALATGSTIPEAARALFISVRTAERRVGEARRILGVRTTAEAVATLGMAGSGDAGDELTLVRWPSR